ncbi:nuclear transport factor 2 family protein [Corynebacterium glyciniphilum]|uniref:nuclear transport factor 2 family protein n=1 Tax=Corynebacterium glyciniphilum TaxID=1404244 RepID=UPI003FD08D4E
MTTELLRTAFNDFNKSAAFSKHLAPEVVLEFPYGPTLGLPATITGRTAVQNHLAMVRDNGLTLHRPVVSQMTETSYLAEYTGTYRKPSGATADIPLISVIGYEPHGITLIREYWDTHRLATF